MKEEILVENLLDGNQFAFQKVLREDNVSEHNRMKLISVPRYDKIDLNKKADALSRD